MSTTPSTMALDRTLIYDVGAHKGEDTEFYLKKGFRVVAVEANPELVTYLRKKFSQEIASMELTVLECAIAKEDGKVSFFLNENTVWGTADPEWATRNAKIGWPSYQITVSAKKFSSILKQYGIPYYLKIDIEGADMECVKTLLAFSTRPQFVSIESNKTSWQRLRQEFDVLQQLGYKKFKIVNQNTVPQQVAPISAIEGRSVEHVFEFGSTGLFGNDLPGEWLSHKQAIARYRRIFRWYKCIGDNTLGEKLIKIIPFLRFLQNFVSWYDTHASL